MSKHSFVNQILVFSKATEGENFITPNFRVREFACEDGTDSIFIHPFIPLVCQMVRNYFDMPFTPNSAYRTIAHNKNVGGATNSSHTRGRAVDIPANKGVTPNQLYDFVDKLFGNWGEVGIYSWGIHVGIQDTKKRFTDSSYKG